MSLRLTALFMFNAALAGAAGCAEPQGTPGSQAPAPQGSQPSAPQAEQAPAPQVAVAAAVPPSVAPGAVRTADHPQAPSEGAGPPMTLSVSGPPRVAPGDQITVTVALKRVSGGTTIPVDIAVKVPSGVTMMSGQASEHLSFDSPMITRTLRLQVNQIPAEDIVVSADMRAQGLGAHAAGAYRFGRPEPRLPQPSAPPVGLAGGRRLP